MTIIAGTAYTAPSKNIVQCHWIGRWASAERGSFMAYPNEVE
nr:hypothetical protein [Microbacterium hydrocarbonoxydans]